MRSKTIKKAALTGAERTRIYRQRKKLRQYQNNRIDEYFERINQRNVERTDDIAQSEIEQCNTEKVPASSNNVMQVKNQLRKWATEHRISKIAINDLLPILKSNGMSYLPLNYRTLQETPTNVDIPYVAGGKMWYNGLRNCVEKVYSTLSNDCTIYLKFNIDGLPLYKSSKISFWPILASIASEYISEQNQLNLSSGSIF